MTDLVTEIKACRSCGSGDLDVVLDLGVHAVSDFYDKIPDDELRAPLCLCQCRGCGLVQLTVSVNKDRLYRNYFYRSSLNPAMTLALKDIVDDAMAHVNLEPGNVALDLGSNDSTLLNHYARNIVTLGIEPSQLAMESSSHWILQGYYPDTKFDLKKDRRAKIISSIAVFYDSDTPNEWVQAIKKDLHPDGVWINQFMDMEGMLHANAFDNVAHEHTVYWSQSDFDGLVSRHGLHLTEMSRNMVNGGSVRFIVKHGQGRMLKERPLPSGSIEEFAFQVQEQKRACIQFLTDCKRDGKTVLGLGASTKGATLLQTFQVTPDLLPAIGERNPDKVGKITAGSHIPIISEQEMRERKPDYLLVFPWAQPFVESFKEREKDLIAQGTRLVVPLPTFRVVA